MSKHTPGPWAIKPMIDEDQVGIFSGPGASRGDWGGGYAGGSPRYVAVADKRDTPAETLANARLIAAAPELLAALVSAKEALDNCPWSDTVFDADDIRLKVESAIAKATGSES